MSQVDANIRAIVLHDGKYTVRFNPTTYNGYGSFEVPYRYDEPWEGFVNRDDGINGGMDRLHCELARRVMQLEDLEPSQEAIDKVKEHMPFEYRGDDFIRSILGMAYLIDRKG